MNPESYVAMFDPRLVWLLDELLTVSWDDRVAQREALLDRWERLGRADVGIRSVPVGEFELEALRNAVELDEERIQAWWRRALGAARFARRLERAA